MFFPLIAATVLCSTSFRTWAGVAITTTPPEMPRMTTNSDKWSSRMGLPPAIMKPPSVDAKTMIPPTIISMGKKGRPAADYSGLRSTLLHALQPSPQTENRLGVDLADARFREVKYLGDFGQAHIFEIVHRKDLLWYIG